LYRCVWIVVFGSLYLDRSFVQKSARLSHTARGRTAAANADKATAQSGARGAWPQYR
jgi:hypothetical protein